ncbi:hypothetical protein [Halobacterium salinarum]|uniref:hypothetical protein n=1 Tax=Halobacterium salinarum TaxID=2242 RepID=UPI002557A103|nr:hypothetical protein [Halobacterium salinarum]MDL0126308.1 hypothetical protein [Halobacterium salinarum]MDL0145716.1 hypothetical protein [Halobacterium salinarum]
MAEWILKHLLESVESNLMLMSEHPRFGEMEVSSGQIRERCAKLAEAGLAASTGKGWFDITTWGQQYLEGELDAENQPKPRPKEVLQ